MYIYLHWKDVEYWDKRDNFSPLLFFEFILGINEDVVLFFNDIILKWEIFDLFFI